MKIGRRKKADRWLRRISLCRSWLPNPWDLGEIGESSGCGSVNSLTVLRLLLLLTHFCLPHEVIRMPEKPETKKQPELLHDRLIGPNPPAVAEVRAARELIDAWCSGYSELNPKRVAERTPHCTPSTIQ